MSTRTRHRYSVDPQTPPMIASALRHWLPDRSWSEVRNLVRTRRVAVGAALCLDEGRRLKPGEWVEVFEQSLPKPPDASDIVIHHIDRHLIVLEKPSGMVTQRHPSQLNWSRDRKKLQPSLEEVVPEVIYRGDTSEKSPLYSVHRIDRATSGVLVFARNEKIQTALIEQFAQHDVVRVYRAVVVGKPQPQTIRGKLFRDRGDGLRGSINGPSASAKPGQRADLGRLAVTHIVPIQSWQSPTGQEYTEIECRLETGRTHQIRIHLSEAGHPLCGDATYRGPYGAEPIPDDSDAFRMSLHAAQLGFTHPGTKEPMHFQSPWPRDMQRFMEKLAGREN